MESRRSCLSTVMESLFASTREIPQLTHWESGTLAPLCKKDRILPFVHGRPLAVKHTLPLARLRLSSPTSIDCVRCAPPPVYTPLHEQSIRRPLSARGRPPRSADWQQVRANTPLHQRYKPGTMSASTCGVLLAFLIHSYPAEENYDHDGCEH